MNTALAAHDSKKVTMENLCIAYKHTLRKHNIFATSTTGKGIEKATGLAVSKYHEEGLGGEEQMAAQIAYNDIGMVIYLCDPEYIFHDEAGIVGIMRACGVHNVPFATNLATAEALLLTLGQGAVPIN